MAAKRLSQATFNWATLAERVPEHQKAQYFAFKVKSDNYLRRMMANPEQPPAIDWQYYANTVPVPGLVQDFKTKYESFKIPVPSVDSFYTELDNNAKEVDKSIAEFKTESNARIAADQAAIAALEAKIPYELMTFEEIYTHNPEFGVDRKEPEFWPPELEQKDMAEPPGH